MIQAEVEAHLHIGAYSLPVGHPHPTPAPPACVNKQGWMMRGMHLSPTPAPRPNTHTLEQLLDL